MVDVSGYPEYDVAVSSTDQVVESTIGDLTKNIEIKEALQDVIALIERLGQDVAK